MDDKTVASAVLESSRLNNLNVEKLAKKQGWTNRLLVFLIISIPLTTWFDNRGLFTVMVQEFGWLKIIWVLVLGLLVVALGIQGMKFIKKE